jgi:hypothetical protein
LGLPRKCKQLLKEACHFYKKVRQLLLGAALVSLAQGLHWLLYSLARPIAMLLVGLLHSTGRSNGQQRQGRYRRESRGIHIVHCVASVANLDSHSVRRRHGSIRADLRVVKPRMVLQPCTAIESVGALGFMPTSYADPSRRLIQLDALQQSLRALKNQATQRAPWSPSHSINHSHDQCSLNADSSRPLRINAIPFTSPGSVWSFLTDAKLTLHCLFYSPHERALVAMPQAVESMQIEAATSQLQQFVPTSHLTLASHFTVEAMVDFRLFRKALALSWITLLC